MGKDKKKKKVQKEKVELQPVGDTMHGMLIAGEATEEEQIEVEPVKIEVPKGEEEAEEENVQEELRKVKVTKGKKKIKAQKKKKKKGVQSIANEAVLKEEDGAPTSGLVQSPEAQSNQPSRSRQKGMQLKEKKERSRALDGAALLPQQKLLARKEAALRKVKEEEASRSVEEKAQEDERLPPELNLLQMSDSDLTPQQIMEKNIIIHDMLIAEETGELDEDEEKEIEPEPVNVEVPEEEAEDESVQEELIMAKGKKKNKVQKTKNKQTKKKKEEVQPGVDEAVAVPKQESGAPPPPTPDSAQSLHVQLNQSSRNKLKGKQRKEKERTQSLHGIALLRQQRLLARKEAALRKVKEEVEARRAAELAAAEKAKEEEPLPPELQLLQMSDSDLTPQQIIEKDIIMHDMLIAEEEARELDEDEEEIESESEPVKKEVPEEEDREAEEESVQEEPPPPPPQVEEEVAVLQVNPDDQDNIISLMIQEQDADAEGEEDEFKLLVAEAGRTAEQETQTVASFPGVVGIDLKPDTLDYFELNDLAEREPPQAYISFKRVKLHIYTYGETSEFLAYQDQFKHYPDFAMLLGVDSTKSTGHDYYLCTTIEARNLVLNPPKKKRQAAVDLKKKEQEAWNKLSSIYPRKWRSRGSELEVHEETVKNNRPLLTVHAYRFRERFNRPVVFSDWDNSEANPNALVEFQSKDFSMFPCAETLEVDAAVQVAQQTTTSSSQTGFSFKRNKMTQYENQFLDQEQVQAMLELPADVIARKTKSLQKILIQNEMMNLSLDDCKTISKPGKTAASLIEGKS